MRRPPRVVVVAPRIGARLDRDERERAVGAGQAAPEPGEVGVQRRRVLVALVAVAPGGVALPDLHQRLRHRPAAGLEHAPVDDDPLPERLAVVLAREVVVDRRHARVPQRRAGQLGGHPRELDPLAPRGAQPGRLVVGIEEPRVRTSGEWSGLQHHRQPLADADADRGDAVAAAARGAARARARPRTRAPEAPSGWPIAIAPPLTLTLVGVEVGPALQAGERLRGERLVELDHDDVVPADAGPLERPVRGLDGRDPEDVGVDAVRRRGPTIRASGSRPIAAPAASSPSSSAAAPSLSGEALPAVTVPSFAKAGFSSPASRRPSVGRMPSSRSSSTSGTGTTQSQRPSSQAAAARRWLAQRERVLRLARDPVDRRPASPRSRRARSSTARASPG